jgi:two-component system cell cycle sensor histidine kinase/response regulator CckA
LLSEGPAVAALESLVEAARAGESSTRIVPIGVTDDIEAAFEISVEVFPGGPRAWRVRGLGTPLADTSASPRWLQRVEAHGKEASAGLYSLDAAGRFLFVNRIMAEWLGRSLAELLGGELRITDLVAGDSGDPLAPGTLMLGLKGADGNVRDFQISQSLATGPGGGAEIHAVARPVGPGGAAAQRFQQLFREMPVGVALLDRRLHIGDCNATFQTQIGEPEAIGRPFLDFVQKDQKIAVADELESVLDGRSSAKSLEARFTGPNEIVASVLVGRMQDDQEAATGLVMLVTDTTEQKNLEAQLAQSQKMQAVGQLAGGIAHDFNNVLTAMIGFCDLLLQRHRPGDQSFADIMQIKQNANRAAALVRQLLAFSRQQTLQPRLLNVTEVLAELSNLLRRLLGEQTELSMVHGRDLGLIKGDQGQLEQVVINLAVNARDAMTGGGRLTIKTSNAEVKRPLQAHGEVMPVGDYVRISVSDTGVGIPEENFNRIFEPFFTTKEVGAGTGLGLSTVYGIVKQTGGYLFVNSGGDGAGATFDIYFRRHHGDAPLAAMPASGERATDLTGGGTVLLVEDEDPVRLFSARALRNKGYKVVEAKTGEAALELLNGGEYDLLVTDMVMPRVDGSQVIREARKHLPELPVICISGYTEESVLKEVESFDNLRFLSKPFSLKQLAGAVKDSIESSERRRAEAGE